MLNLKALAVLDSRPQVSGTCSRKTRVESCHYVKQSHPVMPLRRQHPVPSSILSSPEVCHHNRPCSSYQCPKTSTKGRRACSDSMPSTSMKQPTSWPGPQSVWLHQRVLHAKANARWHTLPKKLVQEASASIHSAVPNVSDHGGLSCLVDLNLDLD